MRRTIYMLPALALMLFAACSSEDAVTKESPAQLNETPENAIGFGAYLNRSVTRAGYEGSLGLSELQSNGFGVFAYYGNGDLYNENALPDFMYNQKVYYSTPSGPWTYTPLKYWPNEFGSSAVSTGVDRVSFFAYAPYVPVDPTTGLLTGTYDGDENTGITSLTRNGKTGDPYVRYVGIFDPDKCVDLCYGVAAETYNVSVGTGDGTNNIEAGKPYINVAKPPVGSNIKFLFKHALAQLTVNVDADINIGTHGDGDALDGLTRVWVRSITFDGVAPRGYLNLNSGLWYEVMDNNKISRASATVYDGLRDGSEAVATDSYEAPTGFNPALIQSEVYEPTLTGIQYTALSSGTPTGVTKAQTLLFKGDGKILVIPANEQLRVTIVYDVETADATLPTYLSDGKTKGSTVENKITKYITIGGSPLTLKANNKYTINLHLGLKSVDFTATVSEWDDGETPDEPWLPQNVMTIGYKDTKTIDVPASTTSYQFKVTGLTKGWSVTCSPTSGTYSVSVSPETVDDGGEVVATVSMPANTTTSIVPMTCTITANTEDTKLNINQAPHALGLAYASATANSITVTTSNDLSDGFKTSLSGATISVKDVTDLSTELFVSVSDLVITTQNLTNGNTYIVSVTANNVTESFSFTKTSLP